MRQLGSGFEGSVALYADLTRGKTLAIKTFTGPVQLQNEIPHPLLAGFEKFTTRWPVEIEASLLFGSSKNADQDPFVTLNDYYILRDGSSGWHWAMVTPYIQGRTLLDLAEAMKVRHLTPQ